MMIDDDADGTSHRRRSFHQRGFIGRRAMLFFWRGSALSTRETLL